MHLRHRAKALNRFVRPSHQGHQSEHRADRLAVAPLDVARHTQHSQHEQRDSRLERPLPSHKQRSLLLRWRTKRRAFVSDANRIEKKEDRPRHGRNQTAVRPI